MAAKSPPRRRLSASIAAIERHNGPADARLPGLHQQAAALRAAGELTTWARDRAAALEPFAPHEAAAVGHLAAIIDARMSGGADAS